jgi:choline dehydrogenase-like flavoprotein
MKSSHLLDINDAKCRDWDVIIMGSGMGGCSAAYQLSQYDRKVLVVEKGLASFSDFKGVSSDEEDPQELLESCRWPTKLTAIVDNKKSQFWAPLGCGAGGSSSLYAGALQRLEPLDFTAQKLPDGSSIQWPFGYDELKPYYEQAEMLYSVCGGTNPISVIKDQRLRTPPVMCETDQYFFKVFQSAGLNPYRMPVAIKYVDSCQECGGHICPKNCKQSSDNACLQPAFETGNVFFVEQAEVQTVDANKKSVRSITIKDKQGTRHQLSAKIFIISAGAYFTPVILQNSKNDDWPEGLANQTGLVGRNLMFHAGSFVGLWPKGRFSRTGPNKTIGLRDFYEFKGKKYGEFQSTGLFANYGNILYSLYLMFDQSPLKKLKLLRHFLRLPAYIAAKLYGDATVFATIVEDYPYKENRIVADHSALSGMRVEYHMHQELKDRSYFLLKKVQTQIAPGKSICMGEKIHLNFGHPCGTCKAGDNPKDSVVDRNCKFHGIDNFYLADSSFMPTSGGTNPSLTIAANALRVADKVNEQLKQF